MAEQSQYGPIMLAALQHCGARLFRNNVGSLQDTRGQWVHFGLCKGSADLIGLTPRIITPDQVGRPIAIFTAIEVKSPRGRVRAGQDEFLAMVRERGGIAARVTSVEEAIHALTP